LHTAVKDKLVEPTAAVMAAVLVAMAVMPRALEAAAVAALGVIQVAAVLGVMLVLAAAMEALERVAALGVVMGNQVACEKAPVAG
jgi:hypothetical protein